MVFIHLQSTSSWLNATKSCRLEGTICASLNLFNLPTILHERTKVSTELLRFNSREHSPSNKFEKALQLKVLLQYANEQLE